MIKIALLTIIFAFIIIIVKSISPDMFPVVLVASGVIILLYSIPYINSTYSIFSELSSRGGLDTEYFNIILKITAIGYIIEFSSSAVEDMGFKSLSIKLVFVGKLVILSISLPIFYSLFNIVYNLL